MALLPPYSTTFINARLNTGAGIVTYVVPANRVALITCVTTVKQSAATPSDFLYCAGPTGSGGPFPFLFVSFIGTTKIESHVWVGHVVLLAGQQITAVRSGVSSDGYGQVCGYLLRT